MEHCSPGFAGQVNEVAVRLEAAFNAKNAVALTSLYADTASLMPPNEPMISGSAEIQAWFERVLPRLGRVRIVPMDSTVLGEQAFQVGTFTTTAQTAISPSGAEGTSVDLPGKYVLLLKRSGEHWKIQHDIWSLDQPAS